MISIQTQGMYILALKGKRRCRLGEVKATEGAEATEKAEATEGAELDAAAEEAELDIELQQARAERERMEREMAGEGAFDEFGSFELPEPDEASDSFSKIGAAVTDDEFNELFGPTE